MRLPWIHLGSMALSHGLLVGNRHATIRTPWPLALTCAAFLGFGQNLSLLVAGIAGKVGKPL